MRCLSDIITIDGMTQSRILSLHDMCLSTTRLRLFFKTACTQQDDFEEAALEVKLEKITLQQVVRLLYEMETTDVPLNVKNLQLRNRSESAALLDATMDISTLRKKS